MDSSLFGTDTFTSMNTGQDISSDAASVVPAPPNPFPQPWESANAEQILQWTINHGYDDVIMGFELGNEQNSKYSGEEIATDFSILHGLVNKLWPNASGRPVLIGPDPHSYVNLNPFLRF